MKNIYLIVIPAAVILMFLSSLSIAQNHQGKYMHIDYLHIDQKDAQSFEQNVEEFIKPIQIARIDSDKINEWYLYRVAFPGSRDTQHNYVVISISNDISGFEDISGQVAVSMHGEDTATIVNTYLELMLPNHSELWRINNSVLSSENSKPSKFFLMDYMKVPSGMEYAYQMMEDEVARPIHELRMELETMKGWELFSLITPGGTEYGYNFATGNYFHYLKNIEFGFTEELIRRSHPDSNMSEFFDNIEETRDLVRSEMWELIDYVK